MGRPCPLVSVRCKSDGVDAWTVVGMRVECAFVKG